MGELAESWETLLTLINSVQLSVSNDAVAWKIGNKGFTVKFLYNSMQTEKPQKIYKVLWKMKLPAKIKIFLWLLLWKRILTKDNLKKRGWLGDHSCMFCAGDESIDHLFFGCSLARFVWGVFQIAFDFVNIPTSLVDLTIAKILLAAIFWTLWKTRNRACFDHILPYDPVGVVFHICHWIDFWGDLQMERERRMLLQGARLLRRVAGEIFNRAKGWTTVGRRIEAGGTVDNPSLC